ncbi:MAG: Ldh family oxidoreductase [Candidatus Lokiarchaeota archaeon]|nr:Ldh family oxidoreductase [Candidatus Lokiarchaeota archaeon]
MSKSEEFVYQDFNKLENFMKDVFIGVGVPEDDAAICADVLIESDKRGIDSHGIARLYMYYLRIIRKQQLPETNLTIIKEMPGTIRLNANNGMGQVASKKAMQMAIDKAKKNGIGMAVVENSNHFGIAGYYVSMAAQKDCIGMCGTNARPSIAPTWSVEPMLGTNPFTFGVPTDLEFDWIADHATSITQRGKIETYARLNKEAVKGWVIDENGNAATNSKQIVTDMLDLKTALTPLGGIGEDLGGHKGYNYATFVEIMSSCLTQANMLQQTLGLNNSPYNLGHFFIAINIAAFCEVEDFKKKIGDMLRQLAGAKKQPGADHIYVAGEKEYIAFNERKKTGVPLSKETQKQLLKMQKEVELENYQFPFHVNLDEQEETGW